MTRIVGGRWAGRRLLTPAGATTRPTAEKVRAALGNALAATGDLDGVHVLDLYAGSGALGLELLSRGAAAVTFVERDRAALTALRGNLAALAVGTAGRVVAADVGVAVTRFDVAGPGSTRFGVVVADPPYDLATAELVEVLAALAGSGALADRADLVVERAVRSGDLPWPDPLLAVRTKRYGDTGLCYGRAP